MNMLKALSQIIGSVMTLIALLSLPYFVGLNVASNDFRRDPEITVASAQSSSVLGISDVNLNPENTLSFFETNSLTNFAASTIGFLALITVASFVKYKVSKK